MRSRTDSPATAAEGRGVQPAGQPRWRAEPGEPGLSPAAGRSGPVLVSHFGDAAARGHRHGRWTSARISWYRQRQQRGTVHADCPDAVAWRGAALVARRRPARRPGGGAAAPTSRKRRRPDLGQHRPGGRHDHRADRPGAPGRRGRRPKNARSWSSRTGRRSASRYGSPPGARLSHRRDRAAPGRRAGGADPGHLPARLPGRPDAAAHRWSAGTCPDAISGSATWHEPG